MQRFVSASIAFVLSLSAAAADQWNGTPVASFPAASMDQGPTGPAFPVTNLPDGLVMDLHAYHMGPGGVYDGNYFVSLADFASTGQVDALQAQIATINTQFTTLQNDLIAGLAHERRLAYGGVAEAMAMSGTADLQSDENFSVAFNMGTYGGETAFAGGAAMRLADHLSLNAGFSANTRGGPVGGRVGIRFGW